MLQKFKITSYALIVGLVLVLPSQTIAESGYAKSCKGWNCSHDGQLCPQGAKGASGTSYICYDSKWIPTTCDETYIEERLQRQLRNRSLSWDSTLKPWYCGAPGF